MCMFAYNICLLAVQYFFVRKPYKVKTAGFYVRDSLKNVTIHIYIYGWGRESVSNNL